MKTIYTVMYNTNETKPKDRTIVIVQTDKENIPYVGKYFENDTFNLQNCPTVKINYNGAFIPWTIVKKWVYGKDIFGEE